MNEDLKEKRSIDLLNRLSILIRQDYANYLKYSKFGFFYKDEIEEQDDKKVKTDLADHFQELERRLIEDTSKYFTGRLIAYMIKHKKTNITRTEILYFKHFEHFEHSTVEEIKKIEASIFN